MSSEFGDDFLQEGPVFDGIPALAGSNGFRGIGHQGDLVGQYFCYQVKEGRGRITFDIELGGDDGFDIPDILHADVPFIRSGVHGNTFCTEVLAVNGGLQDIRDISSARIPQCGNFIYIYT